MLYSICLRTTATVAQQSLMEINTAVNVGCKIYEIGIASTVATANIIGLGFPSIASISPTWLTNGQTTGQATASGFLPEQDTGAPTAKTTIAIAWATQPAVIVNPFTVPLLRRADLQAAITAGVVWNFPKGLYLPPNSKGLTGLCLFNLITGVALDVWVVIDE